MRLINIVTLLAGTAHASPALQQPLPPTPCNIVAANAVWDDPSSTSDPDPTSTSEPDPPCSTPSLMSITCNELAYTSYGEEIYIVGGIADLGDWDPKSAVHLNSSEYEADKPLWYVTVDLPVDAKFGYKYMRKESDGGIVWESDPDRTYTVEGNCDGNATQNDSWK